MERGAAKLQELSRTLAARGGMGETLASDLAEDAAFLRKLKPSLIVARAKGKTPEDGAPAPEAPSSPQLPKRPAKKGEGMNPLVLVGGALVAGIVLAKLLDWRGHAHPRLD